MYEIVQLRESSSNLNLGSQIDIKNVKKKTAFSFICS